MNLKDTVMGYLKSAKEASRTLASASTGAKNDALRRMREGLLAASSDILAANAQDATDAKAAGIEGAMLKRMLLDAKKVEGMAEGIAVIEGLADPVGQGLSVWKRPNGLRISKLRVPLGVVAVVYESRPNVTSDVAALCLKSGNAVVLRGGKECLRTNRVIVAALRKALEDAGLPSGVIQFIDTPEREAVTHLLTATGWVDVVIPRGGESLIQAIVEQARVPVIYQSKGVCHTFLDKTADADMATAIAVNAKTTNPAVCNAMECLLVHREAAAALLPKVAAALTAKGVELRGDEETRRFVPGAKAATEGDWGREFLDLVLAVKVVGSLDEALAHIARYGSGHSEAIVTNDYANAQTFQKRVDAACVYVNASTRFTDGAEFGFGAEIGISTQKLHARGPMGLEELTTVKYAIEGDGQVRG
jgi:glutamate-5-semialdehyde dehydrogenase